MGEALWQNADEEFEMLVLELQRVGREAKELVLEQGSIHYQLQAMKKGGGI